MPLASWLGFRAGSRHAEADRSWLRSELQQATERLIYAAREPGAVIPPREPEPEQAIELPGDLERLVGDWDSPDTQALLRAQFIKQLGEGLSPIEIKRRHLES